MHIHWLSTLHSVLMCLVSHYALRQAMLRRTNVVSNAMSGRIQRHLHPLLCYVSYATISAYSMLIIVLRCEITGPNHICHLAGDLHAISKLALYAYIPVTRSYCRCSCHCIWCNASISFFLGLIWLCSITLFMTLPPPHPMMSVVTSSVAQWDVPSLAP